MNKLSQEEVKEFIFNMKKTLPSGPITRSQARKDSENYFSVLAYEVFEDHQLETSGRIPSPEKQVFDSDYLAISACTEPTKENSIESVFSS